jgi:hypothetical protein
VEEIEKYLDADSVRYLSLEGLLRSVNTHPKKYCTSCYTGNYPVPFPRSEAAHLQLALKLDPAERQRRDVVDDSILGDAVLSEPHEVVG